MANKTTDDPVLIQFGEFRLDRHRFLLYRNADVIKLRTKPCEVLAYLVTNHGRVVPKAELLEAVWKKPDADPNLVEQSIRQIRAVLEADPKVPAWVVTIPGGGYRYLGPKAVPLSDASSLDSGSNGSLPTGYQNAASNSSTQDITLGQDPSASIASRGPKSKAHPLLTRRFLIRVITGGSAAVLGIGIILYVTAPGEPAACEVSVNTLIVKDGQGREVWRHEFLERLNRGRYVTEPSFCSYVDLDGDGTADVVFSLKRQSYLLDGDTLYGFITRRRLLRRLRPTPAQTLTFRPGADLVVSLNPNGTMAKPDDGYLRPYTIAGVFTRSNEGSRAQIVVSSVTNYTPDQIAVLGGDFKKISEYWHTGHLKYGQFANYNGRDRLFLGGVNNGYRSATLIAFDPNNIHGTTDLSMKLTEWRPDFAVYAGGSSKHLTPFGASTETCRVLFERTCVAKATPNWQPYNRLINLTVNEGRISVIVAEGEREDTPEIVTYELDRHLNLVTAFPNAKFQQRHTELEKAGVLNHPFSMEELKPLVHVLPGCEFAEKRQ